MENICFLYLHPIAARPSTSDATSFPCSSEYQLFFFFLIFNYSEDFLSQKFSSPCLLQYYLDSKTWPSLWNDPHEFILSISPGFWNHMLFNLYVRGPQLISTELKKKQVLDHKLADVVRYALSSIMDGFPRFSYLLASNILKLRNKEMLEMTT